MPPTISLRVQFPAVDNTSTRDIPAAAVCYRCSQPLPLGGGIQATVRLPIAESVPVPLPPGRVLRAPGPPQALSNVVLLHRHCVRP